MNTDEKAQAFKVLFRCEMVRKKALAQRRCCHACG
jgi:hypothetical protein